MSQMGQKRSLGRLVHTMVLGLTCARSLLIHKRCSTSKQHRRTEQNHQRQEEKPRSRPLSEDAVGPL